MIKNILYSSCVREAQVRFRYKSEQKWSFLAFRSDSQMLVDTLKLVAPERFWLNSTSFAHSPFVTMIKNTIIITTVTIVIAFFILFDHANTCTSMRSLIKIHNKKHKLSLSLSVSLSYILKMYLSLALLSKKLNWYFDTCKFLVYLFLKICKDFHCKNFFLRNQIMIRTPIEGPASTTLDDYKLI